MDSKAQYWFEIAEYDLETAEAMFKTGRFLYIGFMCHQTIEKALKACWQISFNTVPPRTHNLAYLLEKTEMDKAIPHFFLDLIDELEPLNIQARYPEYKDKLFETMNEFHTKEILRKTMSYLHGFRRNYRKGTRLSYTCKRTDSG